MWQPGQTGNPNGRPKDKPWSDAIRIAAMKQVEDQPDPNYKKIHKIAEKLVEMALEGHAQAVQELGNRLEGKPAQEITQTNIDANGTATLDATALVELIIRIGRARGFALPATIERIGPPEAGILPPVPEAN